MDHFDILIKLLIAHLLGDFFFQPKRWTEKRRKHLIQQYALIGFLIAAKSVLRYSDIKTNYDRKRVEYILIGTLLSFSIAIITGIFTLWIIKNR